MKPIHSMSLLLILACTLSLGSCVSEPKITPANNPVKKDTLAHLSIIYFIPDSNNIRYVAFHASLDSLPKNYRLDWHFSDSSGVISHFDTNVLSHQFINLGGNTIGLSVIDIQKNEIVGQASLKLNILDNSIDQNYLNSFTKMDIYFEAKCICRASDSLEIFGWNNIPIQWAGHTFSNIAPGDGYYGSAGELSVTGNKINTGWLKDSSGGSYRAVGYHGFIVDFYIHYLEFQTPLVLKDADSMVFLTSGKDLVPNITYLVDSAMEVYTTMIPPYFGFPAWNKTKATILPDRQPSPILRIKFYK